MLLESDTVYDAYVDGSFSAKFNKGSWAYTIVQNDQDISIAEASGLIDYDLQPELKKLRNIATECCAVVEALKNPKTSSSIGRFARRYLVDRL